MSNIIRRFYSFVFLCILLALFYFYAYSFIEAKRKPRWSDANSFFNNKISRRENWIELYGLAQRAFGKRQIENFTLYKTSYGKIVQIQEKISDEEINTKLKELFPIINHLNSLGSPCYYITSLLPVRDIEDLPAGVTEWSHSNQQRLLERLNDFKINTINLDRLNQINNISKDRLFYKTDHHWTLETCFAAYQGIINKISNDCGFDLNCNYTTNIDNYLSINKEASFLGSYGIKVGKYYAGKDDFIIYVPKFKTDLTLKIYDANRKLKSEKNGDFYQALIDDKMVQDSNYNNKYNAFCNFGYIENHIINNNAPNNLKCLYISHSYGRPMTMYLSLNFKEIVNLDPQKKRFNGNYLNYIDNYKPDVVLIQSEFEGMLIGEYKTSN